MSKDVIVTDQSERASRGGFLCVERAHVWGVMRLLKGAFIRAV